MASLTSAIFSIAPCENTVIATGGGSVLNVSNILHLKNLSQKVLVLHVFISWEAAVERAKTSALWLPFMTEEEYHRRMKIYQKLCDAVILANAVI